MQDGICSNDDIDNKSRGGEVALSASKNSEVESSISCEKIHDVDLSPRGHDVEEYGQERTELSSSKKNGETIAQMKHALRVHTNQKCTDKDVCWKSDPTLASTDKYCMITSYIFFGLKIIVFVCPLLLLALPITLMAKGYGMFLAMPTERVNRSCCFWICWAILLPFALPFIIIAVIAFYFDCIFYYIFSVPWYISRICVGNTPKMKDDYDCLKPYRNGPSIFCHLPDLFVVMVGQTLRQGVIETTGKLAFMIILVPWIKYYINTNPWLYHLDERFVQQISTSMIDMELSKVADECRTIISQAKQLDHVQDDQDQWSFAPHYPYPPPHRNWALGFQAAGSSATGMFLIVHTTHALKMNKIEKRDPNYFVLSNSVELPIYRVMLWYNNPYHFFTGYVEASVSTGGEHQKIKKNGGEHPMWLVTSRSPMLTSRTSKFGVGWIDHFFDYWLPFFVFEIRKLVRGEEDAKIFYQEVVSADGISPPDNRCISL